MTLTKFLKSTLNTSNAPKDARSARRSIGYTHSLIDASQEGLRTHRDYNKTSQ